MILNRKNQSSKLSLMEFMSRVPVPKPWAEGDNIPWHSPEFSKRMLREHFNQSHDRASRRFTLIDEHVSWIHRSLLQHQPARILDLGCGPGFYSHGLATLGHQVVGIDYSPASIDWAKNPTPSYSLPMDSRERCSFHLADIRQVADYTFGGDSFDLVMMLYGEFNVFCPQDIRQILTLCEAALAPGGLLLVEPQTFAAVEATGNQLPYWSQAQQSVFSDQPHIWLEEFFWDDHLQTATIRYWVIDAQTGVVTPYAQTFQGWKNQELDDLLAEFGFADLSLYPSLANTRDDAGDDLMAFVVRARDL